MLWCVLLLFLIGLLLLPVGIVTSYKDQQWNVFLKLGPIKILLFPKRKKKSNIQSVGDKSTNNRGNEENTDRKSLHNFFSILKPLIAFLSDFRKSVRVNDLRIKIVLAGSDPCDLSVYYGYTCAAVSSLLPYVNRFLYIKNQEIDVNCDYLSEKTTITGSLYFSLPLIILLKLVLRHGMHILKHYHSMKTNEKAV